VGKWETLGTLMPINPVHVALMNNGKVLIVSGSGNVAAETNFRSAVLDPLTGTLVQTYYNQSWDMFCNGMVVLHDGRVFINGGNLKYDPFWGQPKNAVFDPATNQFTNVQNMAKGRWYPTVTTLGDGRVMTFSGLDETSSTNTTVEIYTVGSGWSPQYSANWTPPLYPRMHLLPDGRVIAVGESPQTRIFDPRTNPPSWSGIVANTNYGGTRGYGTSVLLPLRASGGYKASVMILGGGNPATDRTEILDTSASPLAWREGPLMSQRRTQMNATILPNGKVLATGGSVNNEDVATASRNADLYDPASDTFSSAGQNASPRLYHSNALLLPDARVLLLGGNPQRGSYNDTMEIYSPAYLFVTDANGPVPQPTITGDPGPISYGASFPIPTPNPADIRSVVLVRPGAVTHAFDMEQRLIELPFSSAGGLLTATAPPNGNIAPPGYYMLFILNSAGVPSKASFVRLALPSPNQAPTATINNPATNMTVNPGGSVAFSGSGSDPDPGGSIASYAWTFPGGSPASSSIATPGNVTYSTPGSYQASLTVTDNGNLTSAAATRAITVSDFSLAVTPSSRTILQGDSAGYTVSIGALSGFTGTVALSVTSALPAGVTATFTPASVTTSGSSALAVATSATTPAGTYTLTIRGTSGTVSHAATVTLVVNPAGDFTITATPTSGTVQNGSSTDYTIAIAPSGGFNSNVSLSVDALPKFVGATLSPTTITQSGSSTLTLTTKKQTKTGTSTVTVTGTSGPLSHSVNVTLVVQ
jgi:PKD repeat protein